MRKKEEKAREDKWRKIKRCKKRVYFIGKKKKKVEEEERREEGEGKAKRNMKVEGRRRRSWKSRRRKKEMKEGGERKRGMMEEKEREEIRRRFEGRLERGAEDQVKLGYNVRPEKNCIKKESPCKTGR